MAALVTAVPVYTQFNNVQASVPVKIADAVETVLDPADTSIVLNAIGLRMLTLYVKFANYTSVTVKLQESVDGTNFVDIASATTSTTNTFIKLATISSPYIRVSILGTVSAGADTLEVWMFAEKYAVR